MVKGVLEEKSVRKDQKAIKESRVQKDLLDLRAKRDLLDLRAKKDPRDPQALREIGVREDFLDPMAKQGPWVIFSCLLDPSFSWEIDSLTNSFDPFILQAKKEKGVCQV